MVPAGKINIFVLLIFVIKLLLAHSKMQISDLLLLGFIPRVKDSNILILLISVIKLLLTHSKRQSPDLLLLGFIPRVKDSW